MTVEQKAKAYDEALERAKKEWSNNLDGAYKNYRERLEFIFPEVKKNKKEWIEVIRQELKSYLDHREVKQISESDAILQWIAWLEKQGEQKSTNIVPIPDGCHAYIKDRKVYIENYTKTTPADKVEPKFHKGDWIVSPDNLVCKITQANSHSYTLHLYNDDYRIFETESWHIDKKYHLWSIQDAKDGDVLFHSDSASNGIFIFKEIIDKGFAKEVICYCDYDSEDGFCLGEKHTCCWTNAKILHPATKEQRDLLFQKMKEAGYIFDFETKELKKIDTYCQENCKGFQETGRCFCDGDCKAKKEYIEQNLKENNFSQIEQKPAWSKNDDYNVQCLIAKVTYDIQKGNVGRNQELIDWLKSLKYRMNNI